jgi:hypothetical protein
MNATDRKLIGVKTPEEENAKATKKVERFERQEQSIFANLLRQRKERGELIYDWSATHKRTTNITGRADFWIAANNRFLQIEFKAIAGKLSPAQAREKEYAVAAGNDYWMVGSADEANRLLVKWMETI